MAPATERSSLIKENELSVAATRRWFRLLVVAAQKAMLDAGRICVHTGDLT